MGLTVPAPEFRVLELPGKHPMIAFDAVSERQARLANWAVQDVMDEHALQPFHQIGTDAFTEHAPGLHAWETWAHAADADLERLLEQVAIRYEQLAAELGIR